jgi:hypothetical protein
MQMLVFVKVTMLPELPREIRSTELRRSPSAKVQRMSTGADRRRGEAHMSSVINGLERLPRADGTMR